MIVGSDLQIINCPRVDQMSFRASRVAELKRSLAEIVVLHAGTNATFGAFCDYFLLLCEDMPGVEGVGPSDALIREVWAIYREMGETITSAPCNRTARRPAELERQLAELQARVTEARTRVGTETLETVKAMLESGILQPDDLRALLPAEEKAPRQRNHRDPGSANFDE